MSSTQITHGEKGKITKPERLLSVHFFSMRKGQGINHYMNSLHSEMRRDPIGKIGFPLLFLPSYSDQNLHLPGFSATGYLIYFQHSCKWKATSKLSLAEG